MTRLRIAVAFLLLLILAPAMAADDAPGAMSEAPQLTLTSPENGQHFSTHERVTLTYDAQLGAFGNRIQIFLDGRRTAVIEHPTGSYNLGWMKPGTHDIEVEIVDSKRQPTGILRTLSITVR